MTLSSAFDANAALQMAGGVFYPDGTTGADLQDAIDAAVANGGGVVDCRHVRGFTVSQTITVDPTLVTLVGTGGTTLDSSAGGTLGGSNIVLKHCPSASATSRGHALTYIEGFRLMGTGSGGNQIGYVADGTTNGSSSARTEMRNCDIQDYKYGIQILDNAYCNKFYRVDVRNTVNCVRTESGGSNRGESIEFHACTMGASTVIIWAAGHSVDISWHGGSLDFPSNSFVYADDRVNFFGTHFEDSAGSSANGWFQVDNNGQIYFFGGNIGFAAGSYTGTLFKQWGNGGKFRLYGVFGNVPSGTVTVTNAGSDFYSDTGSSSAPFWS